MHSLLKRQIAKTLHAGEHPGVDLQAFIAVVDRTYREFDNDRKMLDRILEINSQELLDSNAEMRLLQEQLRLRNIALEKALHEFKQMQSTLVQSEKMASIGQLTAGIAHEINNPLAFVSSNLNRFAEYFQEVLRLLDEWRETASLYEDRREFERRSAVVRSHEADADVEFMRDDFSTLMGYTVQGTDRMRTIVDRMRVFSHMSDESFTETDLNAAIDDTLAIVWNEVKYKAAIVKEYAVLPPVCCSEGEVKQVLVNLIVNAAQAIEGKGTITLRTRDDGANVIIEVADTGSGIPAEVRNRIFDPFFTTKPVGKGTGLGLWICATIVGKHGGTIAVQSEVGRGTAFTLSLPKSQAPKHPAA